MRIFAVVVAVGMVGWWGWSAGAQEAAAEKKAEAKEKPKGTPRDIEYVDEQPEGKKEPANPLGEAGEERKDARRGRVETSDGKSMEGAIYLTRDKKLHFYQREKQVLMLVGLEELDRIETRVVEEHMEKEWRWKENANDEKVYTGKEYPMREYETVLYFADGRELGGDCTALVYLRNANGEVRYILHKRDKGEVGQKLSDLVYVKSIDFKAGATEKKPAGEVKK